MINEYIKNINTALRNLTEHDFENGFNITKGISDSLSEMATNVTLYRFNKRLYKERLSLLDEKGCIKIINTLYEELNRIDREKTAFGEPRQRGLIDKL
ncbi:MAG: hypothetical protein LRY73_02960 [Bacillus sp. (in: Bacteria)]|nr:hypothetical protein [Bacillus sp. (in: firmicutes)]